MYEETFKKKELSTTSDKIDTLNAHNTVKVVTCQVPNTNTELVFSQIEGCKDNDVKVV